jgi:hypothetical protein
MRRPRSASPPHRPPPPLARPPYRAYRTSRRFSSPRAGSSTCCWLLRAAPDAHVGFSRSPFQRCDCGGQREGVPGPPRRSAALSLCGVALPCRARVARQQGRSGRPQHGRRTKPLRKGGVERSQRVPWYAWARAHRPLTRRSGSHSIIDCRRRTPPNQIRGPRCCRSMSRDLRLTFT